MLDFDEFLKSEVRDNLSQTTVIDTFNEMLCEQSLLHFIETFWSYVEPATPFVGGWAIEAICDHLEAVTNGDITRLLINVPPGFMKSMSTNVFWPAWEWGPRGLPANRYVTAAYSSSLTERDNIRFRQIISAPLYRKMWGDRFSPSKDQFSIVKVGNDKTGWKLATSVTGVGTGERGDRILIDDPNSVKDAESDVVRQSTNQWFTEVVPTRLSNPEKSAIIVIQQRTHEDDVSGIIMQKEMDYDHLMIPMEYEPSRHCATSIGWQDPRGTEDGDPYGDPLPEHERYEQLGVLAFPERFPENVVERDKKTMGPYACNPYEAPVLMSDLTMKPIGEIKAGDEVVGFSFKESRGPRGRQHLTKAIVKAVYSSVKPVVKMTLDSGEVIRCTPDHKWFTKYRGPDRSCYMPATIGSSLGRVCPPSLPDIDDVRLAGWLSGFFDGEGTVTSGIRREGFRPSSSVLFYQGSGRNAPLCEKLEMALKHFGFEYSVSEDERKPNKDAPCYGYRAYRLIGNDLPMYQKFLHIVQPVKWRDRMIEGAYGTKFIKGRERVVSIEPDGEEMTYALETTTGNYVVWGLASSNSAGQFQQSPSPRGGGIFKEEWWRVWPTEEALPPPTGKQHALPPFDYIVASLDSGYTEKEENDPSALVIFGIFKTQGFALQNTRLVIGSGDSLRVDDSGTVKSKLMLIHAWEKHLIFRGPPEERPSGFTDKEWDQERKKKWGLIEWVIDTCRRYQVDHLLIEAKASGKTISQEIRTQFRNENFSVEDVDPSRMGDKVARAHAVVHLFSNGRVFAPQVYVHGEDRWDFPTWSRLVIDRMRVFPKGSRKDIVDATTQALRHLRDIGMAPRSEEEEEALEESNKYIPKKGALYDV